MDAIANAVTVMGTHPKLLPSLGPTPSFGISCNVAVGVVGVSVEVAVGAGVGLGGGVGRVDGVGVGV